MKLTNVFLLIVVVFIALGCAVPDITPLAPIPPPPNRWDFFAEKNAGCPDVSGEYKLIPMVATLKQNGSWQISTGDRSDFVLLMPSGNIGVDAHKPNEDQDKRLVDSLVFELDAQKGVIWVTTPSKDANNNLVHTFRRTEGGYLCENGYLVFPQHTIYGVTEGSILSGVIYRRANLTLAGGLLFYEQVQGKSTKHTYYLFKMQGS